jgi:hypothetical protein
MTDDKGAGEGPYRGGQYIGFPDGTSGLDECWNLDDRTAALANMAHAEGRKSMEKDFEELLELAEHVVDRIGDSGPFGQMHALEKFRAWKKARGIE